MVKLKGKMLSSILQFSSLVLRVCVCVLKSVLREQKGIPIKAPRKLVPIGSALPKSGPRMRTEDSR